MALATDNQTWQELCRRASQEFDSDRLMALVAELMEALDEKEASAEKRLRAKSYEKLLGQA